jgi:hypothetical protein
MHPAAAAPRILPTPTRLHLCAKKIDCINYKDVRLVTMSQYIQRAATRGSLSRERASVPTAVNSRHVVSNSGG